MPSFSATLPRLTALALAAATLAPAAQAQDLYGRVFLGTSDLNNPLFSETTGGGTSVGVETDEGFLVGVAVGTEIAKTSFGGIRGEVELSFSDNDVDQIFFSGNGAGAEQNVSGSVEATRLFLNGYLDFDTGTAFTPYIGAGIGVSQTEIDLAYGGNPASLVRLSNDSTNFAAQLIAGGAYKLSEGLSLTADVRYIRDFDVNGTRVNPNIVGDIRNFEEDLDTYAVTIGLVQRF